MEVKINREIRQFQESVFFGLSLRQFLFSLLACLTAAGLWLLLRGRAGTETVSWICVLASAPFAALGFFRYHGMPAEKFLWILLRSEVLEPKILVTGNGNYYYTALRGCLARREREGYRKNEEKIAAAGSRAGGLEGPRRRAGRPPRKKDLAGRPLPGGDALQHELELFGRELPGGGP